MSVSQSISQSVTDIRTGAPDHVSVNGLLTAARGSVPVSVCEMDAGERKDVKLSAEVEPFIPQKKGVEASLLPMSLCGEGGAEPTQIPSYLITCYPFVQENQSNSRQLPMYNGGDQRWQQLNPSPGGPYLAYPILSSPQPPVTSDYATYYHAIMPTACPPVMGFYQPFPGPFAGPVPAGVLNPVSDCSERPTPQRGRGVPRTPVLHKQPMAQPIRAKRPVMRSVAVQKEVCATGPDGRTKTVLLVDAAQQTDFPGEASSSGAVRCVSDQASPQLWNNKARRRRTSQQESSSEQGASEADIDSDSGYCSPKHNQGANNTSTHQHTPAAAVDAGVMTAVSWGNVSSQAVQKPWTDRNTPFFRGSRTPERSYTQDFQMSFGCRAAGQRRSTPPETPNTHLTPEPLYFQDEDEFPDLATGGAAHRNKPDPVQPKLHKNLLDNLPENSPISIVQTPIPITSSVPKRAKSQRKKALAAALATAQEYSEISMEQKKLQEALSKAAGKKSRTPVQLDLGDMLAALEKQQQAMRARQLNNTKPLSYTGTTL
ncbi:selenocysteine insertion sequence-binding protein 2-like [Rhinichthys klamathensis goyatoka]|uniref:selenocysteine insertion sequence-binding protein 2-like n=1 Tax=Rhinichthys klamathensis goyatoka TaxID=3034132 RepID=UPI0024B51D3E|nr:selenocysteine insertion sequence-binding protein 2-like [Rhinichthys klamathensis goyatoka]